MDSPRPRALFLFQTLPFPPDSGVTIRSYNVLRQLSQVFDVTALCFYRRALIQGRVAEASRQLSAFCNIDTVAIPQEHSRWRFLWDHARSVITNRAYTNFVYQSTDYEARLLHELETKDFELAHVDSLDLTRYLPKLEGLPVVCVHHNVESRLLARRAEAERVAWRRLYMRHQAGLMEREERRWCPAVSLNITVSEADKRVLRTIAPDARITVIPNGVDVDYYTPSGSGGRGRIVYVGGSEWFPNRDAMDYFCKDILPLLNRQRPHCQVQWIGRATATERSLCEARYGVSMTGYVEDVRPFLAEAACVVVPLRVGGGTRLKILTAWAMGKPIVSTSVGREGLDAVDGENILIRDTPVDFAEAVLQLLADSSLRKRLGRAGRETAVRTYSWRLIGEEMTTAYSRLLSEEVGAPEAQAATV